MKNVSRNLLESATEVNKLVAELDKKYQEKFKKQYPDDLTMVYASKCGVMGSFLMSALQKLESVSPEDYKELVDTVLKEESTVAGDIALPESAGDTLDSFEKNLYKAAEAANNGYDNQFKHSSQVAAGMGKRMAKDIKHKRFSNTVSLVDSASVQPDEGDAKYYINLAKREYVLFKSEYSKEESTVAGDIAMKDVSLFRGKDKMQKVKNPVMESVSLRESILRVISQD